MHRAVATGVAVAILGTAAPSLAQRQDSACLNNLEETRQSLQKDERFSAWYHQNPRGRRDYIELMDAARVFAKARMEERCMDVVEGIKELATAAGAPERETRDRDTRDRADRDRRAEKDATPTDRDRARRDPAKDAERARAERRQDAIERLKAAKPLTQANVSAETLTGADVRNIKNEDMGDVGDVLMQNGRITAVIVARGGFLGIGRAFYRVDAKRVRFTEEPRDRDDVVVVLDMSEEEVKALPKVEKEKGRWIDASADDRERREDRDDRTRGEPRPDARTAPKKEK